jgi:hypothetical protein
MKIHSDNPPKWTRIHDNTCQISRYERFVHRGLPPDLRIQHHRRSTFPELFRAFLSITKLYTLQRSSLFITELPALTLRSFPVDDLGALPRVSITADELNTIRARLAHHGRVRRLSRVSPSMDELSDLPRESYSPPTTRTRSNSRRQGRNGERER